MREEGAIFDIQNLIGYSNHKQTPILHFRKENTYARIRIDENVDIMGRSLPIADDNLACNDHLEKFTVSVGKEPNKVDLYNDTSLQKITEEDKEYFEELISTYTDLSPNSKAWKESLNKNNASKSGSKENDIKIEAYLSGHSKYLDQIAQKKGATVNQQEFSDSESEGELEGESKDNKKKYPLGSFMNTIDTPERNREQLLRAKNQLFKNNPYRKPGR